MPSWLAIAIPSVIAVAACIMWAVDYVKKAHEIEKLRLDVRKLELELEKLSREGAAAKRFEDFLASGLHRPTAAEVDALVREKHFEYPTLSAPRRLDRRFLLVAVLGGGVLVYGLFRLASYLIGLVN